MINFQAPAVDAQRPVQQAATHWGQAHSRHRPQVLCFRLFRILLLKEHIFYCKIFHTHSGANMYLFLIIWTVWNEDIPTKIARIYLAMKIKEKKLTIFSCYQGKDNQLEEGAEGEEGEGVSDGGVEIASATGSVDATAGPCSCHRWYLQLPRLVAFILI